MNPISLWNLFACSKIETHNFTSNQIGKLPPSDEAIATLILFPIVQPRVDVVVDKAFALTKFIQLV